MKSEPGTVDFWERKLNAEIHDHDQTRRQRDHLVERLEALARAYKAQAPSIARHFEESGGEGPPVEGAYADAIRSIAAIEGDKT